MDFPLSPHVQALAGTFTRQRDNLARLDLDQWIALVKLMGHMYRLTKEHGKETVQWYMDSWHTGGR